MKAKREMLDESRGREPFEVAGQQVGLISRLAFGGRSSVGHLARDRSALAGFALVLMFLLLAVAAPLIAPHDPAAIHPIQRLSPPTMSFPLGTDNLGRCLLSRLLYGARLSLASAGAASVLVMLIGVIVGAVAGYLGGWTDMVVMRVVDLLLAFPLLILALAITGFVGVGMGSVLIGVVSVWWASYARIVRGLTLALREQSFVEAARAGGVRPARLISRHIIPNVIPPVLVLATLEMGSLLLAISGLNFLGLGAQPPTPEWGAMLNDGRPFLRSAPQLMIYPGLAISLAVLGFNLLGDGLRDALDPRLQ
jgi:peptide/nickel transport system permease protein